MSVYTGACTSCGADRRFEFAVPEKVLPPTKPMSYGADTPSVILDPGDVVVIDPGEEHWHGAAPGSAGEHLAINLGADTHWLESSD